MSRARLYISPKREAQAAATREAILEAFIAQLWEGRDSLSPSDAAARAGVSLRTLHTHFANSGSQIVALGEYFDRRFHPNGVAVAAGPDDLARYYREIHQNALLSPLSRVLSTSQNRGVGAASRPARGG